MITEHPVPVTVNATAPVPDPPEWNSSMLLPSVHIFIRLVFDTVSVFSATGVTGADAADAAEVSFAFVAVTVNVYEVPTVSPVTVIWPEPAWERVPVPPAGLEVAVYLVIGEPPSVEGAVNVTVAVVGPVDDTAPVPGWPGAPIGVTVADGEEASESTGVFFAVAVNVYAVPFVRPVTGHDPEAPVTVHVPPETAGDAVTVYEVGAPPRVPSVAVPAATVTVTLESPATTVGLAGVPAAVTTVTAVDPVEKSVVLVALVVGFFFSVAIRNEYVPSASPVAVHVRAVDFVVAAFAHPVPAPAHVPPLSVETCTSYPVTDCVEDVWLSGHDTTT